MIPLSGRLALLVVTAALLAAGCATDGEPDTAPSPTPSTSTSAPAVDPRGFPFPDRPACAAGAGGRFVRATTSAGNGVGFLLLGEGSGGVVLGPEDDSNVCRLLPYARRLATRYRVALFEWKEPESELPLLAVKALRAAGAQQVVLGGASYGGALAMSEAYRVQPPVAGVLSFSGELTLPGFDGRAGIRRWRGPLLAIGSARDDLFDSRDAARLRALHPGPETVLMLPGRAHGISLLEGGRAAQVQSAASRFLARVLG